MMRHTAILYFVFTFFISSTAFSEEVKKEEVKKTEKELRKEFKVKYKEAKTDGDKAAAIELLAGCKDMKSFKLIIGKLKLKKDIITISVMNALGSCDDSTKFPVNVFIQELKNKKNNILIRGIAARKLSTRTYKAPALEALFAIIKSLNVSNKVKTQKIGKTTPDSNDPNDPNGNTENTEAQIAAAAALEQLRQNIETMNENNILNQTGVKLSKLAAALLLADTCMKSIHHFTKEKAHLIKGNSSIWWNKDNKQREVGKWWKKNKIKFKIEDKKLRKELSAKEKAEKEKAEKEKKKD